MGAAQYVADRVAFSFPLCGPAASGVRLSAPVGLGSSFSVAVASAFRRKERSARRRPDPRACERGFTLTELLFTISVLATITAIAIPLTSEAIDELRAMNAVRYVEGRIMNARMEAVKRSTAVALRFEPFEPDYIYTTYVDGHGNPRGNAVRATVGRAAGCAHGA